jgi:pimeloyl-ACP methyl ester carboxylesterase
MVEDIDLYFIEQGEGIPLVFLHGYPLDHRIWLPVFSFLNRHIHIIAPDLRGHGQSPVPKGVYLMSLVVEDVIRLLDKLQIEKAVIAGHSMGGYVAFEFWHKHPERISGIALVATRSNADSEERRLERLQTANEVMKTGTSRVVNSMLMKLTRRTELYPQVREIMDGISPQGVAGILRGIADRDNASPWLSQITVPVVVIAGKEDQIVPVNESIEMAKKLPNVHLELLQHAGHLPMMEDPAKVADCFNDLVLRAGNLG